MAGRRKLKQLIIAVIINLPINPLTEVVEVQDMSFYFRIKRKPHMPQTITG